MRGIRAQPAEYDVVVPWTGVDLRDTLSRQTDPGSPGAHRSANRLPFAGLDLTEPVGPVAPLSR
jgi:hypothetical protein